MFARENQKRAHKKKEDMRVERNNCPSLYYIFLHVWVVQTIMFGVAEITRDDFPPGFIFGAGTSAYQVEGAVAEDGRKPGIWDTFALTTGYVQDHTTGDIAADQYHKYKEDVKLMHEMGLDAYRFSVSWSRLIPDGRGPLNPKGLQYYNNLIDELVSLGIEPHVTLYQFDLPQALEDEYEGLLNPRIVDDFTAYADICFKELGDRVKYWSTINEPYMASVFGYDIGNFPPGRCSYPYDLNCSNGDSTTEPYRAAQNLLLSHSSAVALYREKYQEEQRGQIGITLLCFWFEPLTNSSEDIAATNRTLEFHIGWFMDPLMHGDYPAIMRETVGSRLPIFSSEESKQLKASFDFIGLTHYWTYYLQSHPNNFDRSNRDFIRDISVKIAGAGFPGASADVSKWSSLPVTPWGFQKLFEYIKTTYGNPPLVIHENGDADFNVDPATWNGTEDNHRIKFLQEYLESLLQSIRNGSNTGRYFVWSLIDCFELKFGYTARYGLYGVDFNRADKRRYPKLSAQWYTNFLRSSKLGSRASSVVHTE